MASTLFLSSDNLITLSGLKDEDDAFVNDATVTARVLDSEENEVSGETWPVTLSYVSGSDGKYQGQVSDALSLEDLNQYYVEVTAVKGSTQKVWRVLARAEYDD